MTCPANLEARLPPVCHTHHPTTGSVVLIRRGEMGFHPVETTMSVRDLSALLDPVPTPSQIEAKLIGCMFGWHVPGADPDCLARERKSC